jgi:uncharacterized membrane protein
LVLAPAAEIEQPDNGGQQQKKHDQHDHKGLQGIAGGVIVCIILVLVIVIVFLFIFIFVFVILGFTSGHSFCASFPSLHGF